MRTLFIVISLLLSCCGPPREPVPPGVIPRGASELEVRQARQDSARQTLLREFGETRDRRQLERVQRIVSQLSRAARTRAPVSVTVLESDAIQNAAATAGNEVYIWTGMIEAVRSEDELAAVLAHEIAHLLANHVVPTQQELLRRAAAQLATFGAGQLAERGSSIPGGVAQTLAGHTAQGLLVNPYTQKLELEADVIGIFLMADAGYDPRAALRFWRRFDEQGGRIIEFLSTHPPSSQRISRIEQHLPRAMARYQS